MDDVDPLVETPPKQKFTIAKLGWWIGGAGFLLALGAVSVLGQGASRFEATAAAVHQVALMIMLIGMIIALVGHRASWLQGRIGILRTPSLERPVLDAQVLDAEQPRAAPAPTTDTSLSAESLVALAFVFCLTVSLAIGESLLLLLDGWVGFRFAGVANFALLVALVLAAYVGKSYLRAFALAALVPVSILFLMTPVLWASASGPPTAMSTRLYGPETLVFFVMLDWMSIIPAGMLGVLVKATVQAMRGRDRHGNSVG